jgi:hypothetical protein
VGQDIITSNDTIPCAPLLNFVRLACTINALGDTASTLAQDTIAVPLADASLIHHRTELVQRKLPGLTSTPIMAAGQQVATSLGKLVQEQRAAWAEQNARQVLSSVKTLDDYFGASPQVLLRICQVATPAPPFTKLAPTAEGERRE